jgi:hypothetical protein
VSNIGTFPYFRSLALLTLAAEYLEKAYNDLQQEYTFHLHILTLLILKIMN